MEMKIGNGEGVSALETRVHGVLVVHGSTYALTKEGERKKKGEWGYEV